MVLGRNGKNDVRSGDQPDINGHEGKYLEMEMCGSGEDDGS
jgi:hypothetical protein